MKSHVAFGPEIDGTLDEGTVLKSYKIGPKLGHGGFGVVYKARHSELGSTVAIKEYFPSGLAVRLNGTVRPSRSQHGSGFDDGLRRFVEEARRLEAFRDCPSIVGCRDLFRANGTAYMVMDYISGLPLSILLERREANCRPFSERDLLDVTLPLLAGLKIVHDSGVYHRDIKPSNILIRQVDSLPVLIDFGAAKQVVSGLTKSMAPYTNGYAAMEQIGEGEIGPWTDIYGLGAVMWRMVAGGLPPFDPLNPIPVQRRAFELMQGKADPMPAAEVLGAGRFSPNILGAIDDCLAINVIARIGSCEDLTNQIATSTSVAAVSNRSTEPNDVKTVVAGAGDVLDSAAKADSRKIREIADSTPLTVKEIVQGFKSAAEKGDANAQFELGSFYATGIGVPRDDREAANWYHLAAKQGHIEAQYNLGVCFRRGAGMQKSKTEAAKWLGFAAKQGHMEAQFNMGQLLLDIGTDSRKTAKRASKWFYMAAKQGHAEAQCKLGECYASGFGVRKDAYKALYWFRMAAKQGHAKAQYKLGRYFEVGGAWKPNMRKAVKYFRLAAGQGYAAAQYKMGLCYRGGISVPQDYSEAVKLFRLASQAGHVGAQYELGWHYSKGVGVQQDVQEAEKWYRLAAKQGSKKALDALVDVLREF